MESDEAGVVDAKPATMTTVTARSGAMDPSASPAAHYRPGAWLAGESVTVICDGGLVHLHHRSMLVAHARKHRVHKESAGLRREMRSHKPPRPTATGPR